MASYFYGVQPQPQQNQSQGFIPAQGQNTASSSPSPTIQNTLQPAQSNSFGGFQPSNFESLPDLVKQNIMQGGAGLQGSGGYHSYLQNATKNYNNFEQQYGVGQVPWALQQSGYNGANLFNPFQPMGQQNVYNSLGNFTPNNFSINSYNPYSGQSMGSQKFSNPFGGSQAYGPVQDRLAMNGYQQFQQQAPGNLQGFFPNFDAYRQLLAQGSGTKGWGY